MPLANIISGPYTSTYQSAPLGQSQNGFRLRSTVNKELVRSDAYGDSAIEGVYRGGDFFLLWVSIEYASALPAYWPYGGAFGLFGQAGTLDVGSTIAQQLSLTVTSGTPAVGNPSNFAANQAIIDENFNGETEFRSGARMLPFSMRLYPYVNSGTRFFTAA
jgi:hypothetical protein